MARMTKRRKAASEKLDRTQTYSIDEALGLVKELATAKFPESIDVSVNLGVDPRKSDQVVRGSTVLPNGTGKTIRVVVFAQGENADKAQAAGADIVGFEDLAESVKAELATGHRIRPATLAGRALAELLQKDLVGGPRFSGHDRGRIARGGMDKTEVQDDNAEQHHDRFGKPRQDVTRNLHRTASRSRARAGCPGPYTMSG